MYVQIMYIIETNTISRFNYSVGFYNVCIYLWFSWQKNWSNFYKFHGLKFSSGPAGSLPATDKVLISYSIKTGELHNAVTIRKLSFVMSSLVRQLCDFTAAKTARIYFFFLADYIFGQSILQCTFMPKDFTADLIRIYLKEIRVIKRIHPSIWIM